MMSSVFAIVQTRPFSTRFRQVYHASASIHWRRLVKNIGEKKVIKSDKCMGVSQLLEEHVPGLHPLQVYAYASIP